VGKVSVKTFDMKPIVFVLGAGGSAAYNFPLGSELVTDILRLEPQNQPWNEMRNADELRLLHTALRYSDHSSIDILLQHRKDLRDIGALAIAACLLPKEIPTNLARHAEKFTPARLEYDRWYGLLFELLSRNRTFEQFAKLDVKFVTFNYERSFDFFLWQWIQAKYHPKPELLNEYMSTKRIFHVHGHFGFLAYECENVADGLEYGARPTVENFKKAAAGIIIPNDDKAHESEGFKAAAKAIQNANTVVFLGFGFDLTNFLRLQVPTADDEGKFKIFGTTYKMSDRARNSAIGLLGPNRRHSIASNSLSMRDFFDTFWNDLDARMAGFEVS
jgi:hypothetical protein